MPLVSPSLNMQLGDYPSLGDRKGRGSPERIKAGRAREDAIKRRLAKSNKKARAKAKGKINKKKGGTKSYKEQYIRGKSQGYSQSDYGVGAGAAIPYQIARRSETVSRPKPKKRR